MCGRHGVGPATYEATLLVQLAQIPQLRIVGINYKDEPENARRFLGRYGNPFSAAGADPNGRAAIEWGVYGVPETFIVGRDGRIAYKLVGPITPENLDTVDQAGDREGAGRSGIVGHPRFPGAAQHAVMRCRPGIVTNSKLATVRISGAPLRAAPRPGHTALTPAAQLHISSTADTATRRK